MARTMFHENHLPKYLGAEVVNISYYVQNKIYIRLILNKTSYELFKGRNPSISNFLQFGFTRYVLSNKVYLKKFYAKGQKGIFLGYSKCSNAHKVYNSKTRMVEESVHVKFDVGDY